MCGIAAIFSRRGDVAVSMLKKANVALEHRGPDGDGVWVAEDGHVGLAHARLSIIDLRNGQQPLSDSSGDVVAVVNGEFYGYERIRDDLRRRGHEFKTQSDSEILIGLYREYGNDLFEHLRGEFSFVLWDRRIDRLFIARDRFGINPLYYAFYDEKVWIASEIKALVAMGVPARWNWRSVALEEGAFTPPTETLFENVKSLAPGHYAVLDGNGIAAECYWDIHYSGIENLVNRDSDRVYIDEFSRVFEESVRLRLRADVPVACYLSGGLDSCSILGTMATITSDPIDAFTLSFTDDDDYNEGPAAEEMAKACGAGFFNVEIRNRDLADNFADAIWHNENSLYFTSPVAKFILSRKVKECGHKVVLTGEGADELLAGYPNFREDVIRFDADRVGTDAARSSVQALRGGNGITNSMFQGDYTDTDLSLVEEKFGFVPTRFSAMAARSERLRSLRTSAFDDAVGDLDPAAVVMDNLRVEQLSNVEPLNKSLYFNVKYGMPSVNLTALGDRMEMAHSVEARLPFLDHRVAELSARLPCDLKIRDLTEKYILRESRRHLLPDSVYRKQKHPFVAPQSTGSKRNPLIELMQDTFHSESLASLPFYDRGKVLGLMARVERMPKAEAMKFDNTMNSILSLCILQEKFGIAG